MSDSKPRKPRDPRTGLRTSATLATVLTLLGHTVLGFEQPASMILVALVTGYSSAIFFEWLDARVNGRQPGYRGKGWKGVVDYLLSAHMTSITMSFLIYTNSRMGVMAFAVAAAIASKYLFRVEVDGKLQHFMNPSNFGIALAIVMFPWIAPIPYVFTEHVTGFVDVLVPAVIFLLGFRLNYLFTRRIPLILSWLGAYVFQAFARWILLDHRFEAAVASMTGAAFVLFSFYMITDPRTSPSSQKGQIAFGTSIGLVYGVLIAFQLTFTAFFAVTVVAGARGALLYVSAWRRRRALVPHPAPLAVPES
ncbi:MAG TPA: RnfABCDGE type electron transport complex subunit D [Thermoanaerobaculia bacterium]|nr:RnfABCDGE type electron transport complex subunit D [Thermoanaerobaculia bacterium]